MDHFLVELIIRQRILAGEERERLRRHEAQYRTEHGTARAVAGNHSLELETAHSITHVAAVAAAFKSFIIVHNLAAYLHFETAVGHALHVKRHGHVRIGVFLLEIIHHFLIHLIAVFAILKNDEGKPHRLAFFGFGHLRESEGDVRTSHVISPALLIAKRAEFHPGFGAVARHLLISRHVLLGHREDKSVHIITFSHIFYYAFTSLKIH